MRSLKKLLSLAPVAAAAVALSLVGTAAPSVAAPSAAVTVVQGGGTITPALNLTDAGAPHSFTFTSVAITTVGVVNGGASVADVSNCSAGGNSAAEVFAAAIGGQVNNPTTNAVVAKVSSAGATFSCTTGVLAGKSGGLIYARVGAVVPVVLSGNINGALLCLFVPDQTVPPVSSYKLTCAGAGAGA